MIISEAHQEKFYDNVQKTEREGDKMNDFTKEELKWIATSITGYDFDSLSMRGQMELKSVFNKVKSMIDNYCEHELECCHEWECEMTELPICGTDIPLMPTITKVKCKHCGKLNDNQ